jgi:hypothetical protein
MLKLNVRLLKGKEANEPSKQKAPTCKFNKCVYDASYIHVYSINDTLPYGEITKHGVRTQYKTTL